MKLLRRLIVVAAGSLAFTVSARAQVLIGTVVDNANTQPIPAAEILVIQGDSFKSALTDGKGRFTIYIAPGAFRLRASALGYEVVTSDTLEIERLQRLVMDVVLSVEPVEIAPINVVSRRPQLRFGREGFQWRRERSIRTGMGRILDAGDIARYRAMTISDLVRRQPFMSRSMAQVPYYSPMVWIGRPSEGTVENRLGGPTSMSGTPYGSNMGRSSPCAADGFAYYVNGVLTRLSMEIISSIYSPSDLVGIEIYKRPYEAPGEFGGSLYNCGRIVIWTR